MATYNKPTRERVLESLVYDGDLGAFFWKKTEGRKVAGREAGWVDRLGYRSIRLDGTLHRAHHLVVLMESGVWPSGEVDHIDGDPSNNAKDNLRVCTHAENQRNMRQHRDSKSPFKGVSFQAGKWLAQICVDGRQSYLGRFTAPEDAARAYNEAAALLHGRFARPNESL